MCPPTDDPLEHLRRANDAALSPGRRHEHWQIFEGRCWLTYCERHPLPAFAERALTIEERVAIFKAREQRSP